MSRLNIHKRLPPKNITYLPQYGSFDHFVKFYLNQSDLIELNYLSLLLPTGCDIHICSAVQNLANL